MFRNNLKIAFRNLRKHKSISFINIFGLAIGMACCLLILLFVKDEISYDRYNRDADRIVRIVKDFVNDDGSRLPDATSPAALAPAMQSEIPEVEHITRVFPGWGNKFLISYGDKRFIEERFFRVDSSFFDVFTFPFIRGNAQTAFKDLNSILITESTAKKYFGSQDPMGKLLKTDFGDMMVNGVLKDVPENSHFHFDFLISIKKFGDINSQWGWYNFYTYAKLKPHSSIAALTPKIQALFKKNDPDGKNIFYVQPLTDIHLTSDLKWEIEPNSDKLYTYVFSLIGVFIIVIACINYINLATAKSALRAKEIGIRKVAGAFRVSLIRQFLTESVITVSFALMLSIALAQLFLPVINQLVQKHLSLSVLFHPLPLLAIFVITLIIGLAAGLYPAIYLSSFKPVWVLKGLKVSEKGIFNLRKSLVVLQFTISITLIAGTAIVMQQLRYIQNKKLGLNKDQVMIISDAGNLSKSDRAALQNELLKINSVKKVATANGEVGGQNWTTVMKSRGSQNGQLVNFLGVGYDYLDVLGISIKEGRSFSSAFPADTLGNGQPGTTDRIVGGVVLNEKAIKDLGVPEPAVGRYVSWGNDHDTTYYLKIVGVAHDFHFASFKSEIKPFAFVVNTNWQDNFTLKVEAKDLSRTIAQIEKKWSVFSPGRPFRYSFLDETFSKLYQSEKQFNKVVLYITILAIIIACMGLFGLTAFMIERRTKEIGIRKVIGASATSIVTLLSKDFIKLVAVSILIASPIAWYAMNNWLQHFAYRTQISWWIFIVAGAAAILIALITISFQAIKAAFANPVKSLRTE